LHNEKVFTLSFWKDIKFTLPMELFNELNCDEAG
jgi:hypothetical protein